MAPAHFLRGYRGCPDGRHQLPGRSANRGKLLEVSAQEGNSVRAGETIARLDDTTLPPGASLELALIRAPVNGIVLKKLGSPGEVLGPGQLVPVVQGVQVAAAPGLQGILARPLQASAQKWNL
ncbi:hypothetical protein [Desulfofundulus thermocisternus]|uniref:hypothetical protein n=1 Tax=Desulfofundulus thermocisternus TaxID=42471 RepID=UPI0019F49811|nr:hypothetical protein [Desulfofundulus thermocisternus]MBE3585904.1 hypothetical protein [Thermoanaerobacter sp.]